MGYNQLRLTKENNVYRSIKAPSGRTQVRFWELWWLESVKMFHISLSTQNTNVTCLFKLTTDCEYNPTYKNNWDKPFLEESDRGQL